MSENIEYWDAYYPDGTRAGVDLIRGSEKPESGQTVFRTIIMW